jgi:hypothetical protein
MAQGSYAQNTEHHVTLSSTCFNDGYSSTILCRILHLGDKKMPLPPIQLILLEKIDQSHQSWWMLFLKLPDLDNRLEHVAKMRLGDRSLNCICPRTLQKIQSVHTQKALVALCGSR